MGEETEVRGGGGNPPFPRVLYETLLCVELVSLVNVSVITLLPTMAVNRYFDSRVEHGTCTTHDTPNGCGFCYYSEGE